MARDLPNNRIAKRVTAPTDNIQYELNQAVNRVNSEERILGRAAARSMIRGAAKMEEAADQAARVMQRYEVGKDFARQKNALKSGIEAVTQKFGAKAAREEIKKLGKIMYKNAGSPAALSMIDAVDMLPEGPTKARAAAALQSYDKALMGSLVGPTPRATAASRSELARRRKER